MCLPYPKGFPCWFNPSELRLKDTPRGTHNTCEQRDNCPTLLYPKYIQRDGCPSKDVWLAALTSFTPDNRLRKGTPGQVRSGSRACPQRHVLPLRWQTRPPDPGVPLSVCNAGNTDGFLLKTQTSAHTEKYQPAPELRHLLSLYASPPPPPHTWRASGSQRLEIPALLFEAWVSTSPAVDTRSLWIRSTF